MSWINRITIQEFKQGYAYTKAGILLDDLSNPGTLTIFAYTSHFSF